MAAVDLETYERRHKRLIYALILVALLVMGTFVSSVIWANRAAQSAEDEGRRAVRESEQAWCEILVTLDEGQKENPPRSQAGREFAEDLAGLRRRFGCE